MLAVRCRILGAALLVPLALHEAVAGAEDVEAGRKAYVRSCARCHRLYDPGRYSEAAWREWAIKMRARMRMTDDAFEQMMRYAESVRMATVSNVSAAAQSIP